MKEKSTSPLPQSLGKGSKEGTGRGTAWPRRSIGWPHFSNHLGITVSLPSFLHFFYIKPILKDTFALSLFSTLTKAQFIRVTYRGLPHDHDGWRRRGRPVAGYLVNRVASSRTLCSWARSIFASRRQHD